MTELAHEYVLVDPPTNKNFPFAGKSDVLLKTANTAERVENSCGQEWVAKNGRNAANF
jgi:hypothetical protein